MFPVRADSHTDASLIAARQHAPELLSLVRRALENGAYGQAAGLTAKVRALLDRIESKETRKGKRMRYMIGDREVSVRFQYDKEKEHEHGIGVTTCHVDYVEGRGEATQVLASYEGQAECSDKDAFSRRDGRRVSLTRAMAKIAAPRDDKRGFWREYFARTEKEAYRP